MAVVITGASGRGRVRARGGVGRAPALAFVDALYQGPASRVAP
jgi:hypothetical protein